MIINKRINGELIVRRVKQYLILRVNKYVNI